MMIPGFPDKWSLCRRDKLYALTEQVFTDLLPSCYPTNSAKYWRSSSSMSDNYTYAVTK